MWNLVPVLLETVLVLVRDRCTVCTKRTIGSETILDAPNDTPSWRGLSAQFSMFGHSANLNAR
jgi:hypothetical protein